MGRQGIGDGLYVRVADKDSMLDDPVGVVFVPLGRLLQAKDGTLTLETDASNGIEKIELGFTVEAAPAR